MKDKHYQVLFVCTGNACRSPMAEGILKHLLPEDYHPQVKVVSAGTAAFNGDSASVNAITVAQEHGIHISRHRSQMLSKQLMRVSDIVFVMTEEHYQYIAQYFPKYRENVFLLKNFDRKLDRQRRSGIADPIGQSRTFYRRIYRELENEIRRILPRLLQLVDIKLERAQ